MNTTTKLILGISVAAVAGAAIGMLLAPEKGTDLQKRIKERAADWLSEFSSLVHLGKEIVNDVKTTTENSFKELSSELIDHDSYQLTRS